MGLPRQMLQRDGRAEKNAGRFSARPKFTIGFLSLNLKQAKMGGEPSHLPPVGDTRAGPEGTRPPMFRGRAMILRRWQRDVPSSACGGCESGPRRDPPSDVQRKIDYPPEMAKSRPVFPISKNMTAPVQFFIMADWILLFFICNSPIFRCCYIIHRGNSIPISIFTRFPINSADFP